MKLPLTIFDKIRDRDSGCLKAVPCLDISGTDDLRRKFAEAEKFPESVHLPFNPIIIGAGVSDKSDDPPVHEIAVVASEQKNQIILWPFVLTRLGNLGCIKASVILEYPTTIRIQSRDCDHSEELHEFVGQFANICVSALMIIASAENIVLVDYKPQMSRQVQRDRLRRDQIIRHKVLAIKTSKKTYPIVPGGRDNSGIPIYWVRGNFAAYDVNPLFGKFRGTFWRPAHLRGNGSAPPPHDYKLTV